MQEHPAAMRNAFIYSSITLDATSFGSIFTVEKWSDASSNKFSAEKRTMTYWMDFLQDLEGELNSLLLIITGRFAGVLMYDPIFQFIMCAKYESTKAYIT